MKNIIIKITDNCELIKEDNTTFKIITEREPKTWEEFCDTVPIIDEYYIDQFSEVSSINSDIRNSIDNRTLCATREEAEAIVALIQLRRLKVEWDKYEKKIFVQKVFLNTILYGTTAIVV